MTPERKIAVLVGSLRKSSFNRQVATALAKLGLDHLRPEIIEIGKLPHYNQDSDDVGPPPVEWLAAVQYHRAGVWLGR
jgi:chromate reductase